MAIVGICGHGQGLDVGQGRGLWQWHGNEVLGGEL